MVHPLLAPLYFAELCRCSECFTGGIEGLVPEILKRRTYALEQLWELTMRQVAQWGAEFRPLGIEAVVDGVGEPLPRRIRTRSQITPGINDASGCFRRTARSGGAIGAQSRCSVLSPGMSGGFPGEGGRIEDPAVSGERSELTRVRDRNRRRCVIG